MPRLAQHQIGGHYLQPANNLKGTRLPPPDPGALGVSAAVPMPSRSLLASKAARVGSQAHHWCNCRRQAALLLPGYTSSMLVC